MTGVQTCALPIYEGPWLVPQRWIDARELLNPVTQLNFVSTADIGGGDYGSATVNQRGELVGVTFDGNLESLPVTYLYSDDQARAVHVDVRGIVEALDRVYKAAGLLKELGATPGAAAQSEPRPGYPLGRERMAAHARKVRETANTDMP